MCIDLLIFRVVFKKNLKQLLLKQSRSVLFNMAATSRTGLPVCNENRLVKYILDFKYLRKIPN